MNSNSSSLGLGLASVGPTSSTPKYLIKGLEANIRVQHALKVDGFTGEGTSDLIQITQENILIGGLAPGSEENWGLVDHGIALIDIVVPDNSNITTTTNISIGAGINRSDLGPIAPVVVDSAALYYNRSMKSSCLLLLINGDLYEVTLCRVNVPSSSLEDEQTNNHQFHARSKKLYQVSQPSTNNYQQLRTLEADPVLLVDPHHQLAVVHYLPGVVLTFHLNEKSKTEISLYGAQRTSTSFLGLITVQYITLLIRTPIDDPTTIAVIYRDHSFRYSMRYYSYDKSTARFILSKQFRDFESPPRGIVAAPFGGVFVITDLHLFYFPDQNLNRMELSDSEMSNDNLLAVNGDELILTYKLMRQHKPDIELSALSAFVCVDNKRLIAISASGMTYLIHYDFKFSRNMVSSLTISEFGSLKLGYSTVATGIVHLKDGFFFAMSTFSKSILFSISPIKPHINIWSTKGSAPPVLHIETSEGEIFTCQGNYESSEFRNIGRQKNPLIRRHKIRKTSDVNSKIRSMFNIITSEGFIFDFIAKESPESPESPESTLESFSIGSYGIKNETTNQILFGSNLSHGKFIKHKPLTAIVTTEYSIELIEYDGTLFKSIQKQTFTESIRFLSTLGENFFMLTFIDNSITLFNLLRSKSTQSTQFNTLLTSEPLTSDENIYSCELLVTSNGSIWILISLFNGCLVHMCYDNHTNEFVAQKHFVERPYPYPFKIQSQGDKVILFSGTEVFCLIYNPVLDYYERNSASLQLNDIDNILLNDDVVLIKFESSTVEKYEFQDQTDGKEDNVYYSNLLLMASIRVPNKPLSILVSSKRSMDSGVIKSKSSLILLNNQSMEELFTFDVGERNLSDLCWIGDFELQENLFVVLECDNKSTSPLMLFNLRDFETIEQGTWGPVGNYGHGAELRGIKLLDSKDWDSEWDDHPLLFILSGEVNFVVELSSKNGELKWSKRSRKIYTQKVSTADLDVYKNYVLLCDFISGPELLTIDKKFNLVKEENVELGEQVLTTSACMTEKTGSAVEEGNFDIWCGSMSGSLHLIEHSRIVNTEGSPGEVKFKWNNGSQINRVKKVRFIELDLKALNVERVFPERISHGKQQFVVGGQNGSVKLFSRLLEADISRLENAYPRLVEDYSTWLEEGQDKINHGREEVGENPGGVQVEYLDKYLSARMTRGLDMTDDLTRFLQRISFEALNAR